MFDALIVGAGPAGLSASIYLQRAGYHSAVADSGLTGGTLNLTEEVDNYLGMPKTSGMDMAKSFTEHALQLGTMLIVDAVDTITYDEDTKIFTTAMVSGSPVESKTVVYAAGAKHRKLGVPGEDLNGVSYCATCDGMFFEGDPVALVGGGNTAAEDALYLANVAERVDVYVRSVWRAERPLVAALEVQDNVFIHLGENITEIHGEDGNVSGITTTKGEHVPVYGVFVAAGQVPNSGQAHQHTVVSSDGFIVNSTTPGFFVAGDVREPEYRQVAVAVGDGAKAGIDATKFLQLADS